MLTTVKMHFKRSLFERLWICNRRFNPDMEHDFLAKSSITRIARQVHLHLIFFISLTGYQENLSKNFVALKDCHQFK